MRFWSRISKRVLKSMILFFLFDSSLSLALSLRDYSGSFPGIRISSLITTIADELGGLPVAPEDRLLQGGGVRSEAQELMTLLLEFSAQGVVLEGEAAPLVGLAEKFPGFYSQLSGILVAVDVLALSSVVPLNPQQFINTHLQLYNAIEEALMVFIHAVQIGTLDPVLQANLYELHTLMRAILTRYSTMLTNLHSMRVTRTVPVLVPISSMPAYIAAPLFLSQRVAVPVPVGYVTVWVPGILFVPTKMSQRQQDQ